MNLVRRVVPHAPLWQGASVLVVDDEAPIRHIVRRALELQAFSVEEAEDGEFALALVQAREDPFDLVLTDLKMPRIDGRQVAEVIALYQPSTAIVCMSADPAGVALIHESDVDVPMLRKPFTVPELCGAVRKTLSHTAHLMALAESEIARTHENLSKVAAALEASRRTRREMLDLVAAARELRRSDRPIVSSAISHSGDRAGEAAG
jgi:DNA-binding response OmpR family regulator